MLLILFLLLFPLIVEVQTVGDDSPAVAINFECEIVADGTVNRALTATVGDSLSPNFDPTLTITAWNDECRLKIDLPTDSGVTVANVSTGRRNQSDAIDFTQSDGIDHKIYKRDDGNLEWEIILSLKPIQNSFSFLRRVREEHPVSNSVRKIVFPFHIGSIKR